MSCPVVSTPNGKVSGAVLYTRCKDAKAVYTYRNIPFAKPPTGSLRFAAPQPAEPWTGTRDGTMLGNIPMQSRKGEEMMTKFVPIVAPDPEKIGVDEDCLHVSVYTPEPSKGKNLAVMVWLYGGGFQMGSEAIFEGTALAGMNDVVVVVPNYRVGVFGFLSFGSKSSCKGNFGIMDQRLTLEWVRDNIDVFGGDKNNVTIFGESAGGHSVNDHVISPMSRGLFHRAISHSGQSSMPLMFESEKEPEKARIALLEELKINEKDEAKILEALRKVSATELVKVSEDLALKSISFFPCFDGEVFPKTPKQCLADLDFNKVPYIIGCNSTEGQGFLAMMGVPDFIKGVTLEQAEKSIYIQKNEQCMKALQEFYIKDENDDKRFSKMFGSITGGTMFLYPAVATAKAHSKAGADTFLYQGAFQLRFSHDEEFGQLVKKPDWCICDHGDDVFLMLGFPFLLKDLPMGARFSDEEAELSRKCMTYITNFAKYGDPNKGCKVGVVWPKYKPGGEHIVLATPVITGSNLAAEEVEFWGKTFPEIQKKYPILG